MLLTRNWIHTNRLNVSCDLEHDEEVFVKHINSCCLMEVRRTPFISLPAKVKIMSKHTSWKFTFGVFLYLHLPLGCVCMCVCRLHFTSFIVNRDEGGSIIHLLASSSVRSMLVINMLGWIRNNNTQGLCVTWETENTNGSAGPFYRRSDLCLQLKKHQTVEERPCLIY